LLLEIKGSEKVREARIWVNGIIGWERWLVLVAAMWFASVFLWRDIMDLPHLAHSHLIAATLKRAQGSREERLADAESLSHALERPTKGAEPEVKTVPTTILLAACREMKSIDGPRSQHIGDRALIETICNGLRRELEHSRVFFEVMLPLFPTIGFIGTVRSLLIAMSRADRIVSTLDVTAKGIAASEVTSILSLCFSTTFMALMCVLVFSPLALLQRSREDSLVDRTELAVQENLLPEQL